MRKKRLTGFLAIVIACVVSMSCMGTYAFGDPGEGVELQVGVMSTEQAVVPQATATTSISKATVTGLGNKAYTGKAVTPKPTVKLGGKTLRNETDYSLKYANNVKAGTATVVITGKGAYSGSVKKTFKIIAPSVSYRTHVQLVGWQRYVRNGAVAGTSGRSLRLEAMNLQLGSKPVTGSIQYRTHIQSIGWEKTWKRDNQMSGTSGRSLRLEAMQVQLTGNMAKYYDIYYRVHAQHFGWMGWAKNGERAGTAGYSYRLEAMQIVVVPKGQKAPGSTANAFRQKAASPSSAATAAAVSGASGSTSQESADGTVYITNTGSKFHRGWCSSLSKSKIPISREDAVSRGYGACKICKP